jgi:hypothetical protein
MGTIAGTIVWNGADHGRSNELLVPDRAGYIASREDRHALGTWIRMGQPTETVDAYISHVSIRKGDDAEIVLTL